MPVSMNSPVCKFCNGTGTGVQFNLFPKTGHKFGDICVPCESAEILAAELA